MAEFLIGWAILLIIFLYLWSRINFGKDYPESEE